MEIAPIAKPFELHVIIRQGGGALRTRFYMSGNEAGLRAVLTYSLVETVCRDCEKEWSGDMLGLCIVRKEDKKAIETLWRYGPPTT